MGETSIEWTDATWNPVRGCSRVSPGCERCYAETLAGRYCKPGQAFEGFAVRIPAKNGKTLARWTRRVELVPSKLDEPLHWRSPRRVFVNSMSDLFHESLSNEDIAAVFGVMAAAPQHTFQVLTKRPARMREWFAWATALMGTEYGYDQRAHLCWDFARQALPVLVNSAWNSEFVERCHLIAWPLSNVWLGVSAENQDTADERIPLLLETPAAVRFVSYEPALGPINLQRWLWGYDMSDALHANGPWLDWIIAGSESGPGARPAELEWFRSVRDQCAAAGVSFFFKQWVGPSVNGHVDGIHFDGHRKKVSLPVLDGRQHVEWPR